MSTTGQFSTKNPTIKRILKEASELSNHPSSDYHATPLESNLFEWHFTLRGPPSPSPFANGIYHGRIVLPPTYPLRPPSFRFLTPSGRFEPNREICLSISGHHEESWQPAWGIRTALVAIRSFMDSEAGGQLGGMSAAENVRRRLAAESKTWRCQGCGKNCGEIMEEQEEKVREMEAEGGKKEDEKVPDELRLGYKDELGKGQENGADAGSSRQKMAADAQGSPSHAVPTSPQAVAPATTTQAAVQTVPATRPLLQHQLPPQAVEAVPGWVDKAIIAVLAALAMIILRRFT